MPDMSELSLISGAKGFIHHAEDAPLFHMQGILWTMLADRDDTGGRWSMMEQLMPQGAGPPPHKHLWSDETFYILDGTITFLLEGEIRTAGKGAFVNIARNTRHAFRVHSDTARILNGYTPPAWRRWSPSWASGRTRPRSHRPGLRCRPASSRCRMSCSPATA